MKRCWNYTILCLMICFFFSCFDDDVGVNAENQFIGLYGLANQEITPVIFLANNEGFLIVGNGSSATFRGNFNPTVWRIDLHGNQTQPVIQYDLAMLISGIDTISYEYQRNTDLLNYKDAMVTESDEIYLLAEFQSEKLADNSITGWPILTMVNSDGTFQWSRHYPNIRNTIPIALGKSNEQIMVLAKSDEGMRLTHFSFSGNLVADTLFAYSDPSFPIVVSTLEPRDLISNETGIIIIADGFLNGDEVKRPILLEVVPSNNGFSIKSSQIITDQVLPIAFSNDWYLKHLSEVVVNDETLYFTVVNNITSTQMMSFGQDLQIRNKIDLKFAFINSDSTFQANDQIEINHIIDHNGQLLISGAMIQTSTISKMFWALIKPSSGSVVRNFKYGPGNSKSMAYETIPSPNGGFTILGEYELDGQSILSIIKTDENGQLGGN